MTSAQPSDRPTPPTPERPQPRYPLGGKALLALGVPEHIIEKCTAAGVSITMEEVILTLTLLGPVVGDDFTTTTQRFKLVPLDD